MHQVGRHGRTPAPAGVHDEIPIRARGAARAAPASRTSWRGRTGWRSTRARRACRRHRRPTSPGKLSNSAQLERPRPAGTSPGRHPLACAPVKNASAWRVGLAGAGGRARWHRPRSGESAVTRPRNRSGVDVTRSRSTYWDEPAPEARRAARCSSARAAGAARPEQHRDPRRRLGQCRGEDRASMRRGSSAIMAPEPSGSSRRARRAVAIASG